MPFLIMTHRWKGKEEIPVMMKPHPVLPKTNEQGGAFQMHSGQPFGFTD